VRVSTEEQASQGVSLDAQRAKVVAYCGLHGVDLAHTYADEGLSGKRADRPPRGYPTSV
jgi:DNA invertase Pin-like site-specific DNA recombinase